MGQPEPPTLADWPIWPEGLGHGVWGSAWRKLPGRQPRSELSCFPRRRAARPRRPVPRGGRRLAAHGRRRWLRHQGERGDGQGCVDQALPPVRPGRAGRGRRHGCERQRLRIRLLVLQHSRSVGSATEPAIPVPASWGSRVLLALWAALCALWRSGRAARRLMVQAAAEQPASANSPLTTTIRYF